MGKSRVNKTKYTSSIRIKNKTRKLEKRLKSIAKEVSKEHIRRDCRIGRKMDGVQPESFKFRRKNNNGK
jgi:hypothetical protein